MTLSEELRARADRLRPDLCWTAEVMRRAAAALESARSVVELGSPCVYNPQHRCVLCGATADPRCWILPNAAAGYPACRACVEDPAPMLPRLKGLDRNAWEWKGVPAPTCIGSAEVASCCPR